MTADKEARDSRQGDPEVRRPVVFTLLLVLAAGVALTAGACASGPQPWTVMRLQADYQKAALSWVAQAEENRQKALAALEAAGRRSGPVYQAMTAPVLVWGDMPDNQRAPAWRELHDWARKLALWYADVAKDPGLPYRPTDDG